MADVIKQSPEEQIAYGQQCIDAGNAHIAYHTQRLQQMSDAVDTLGDVHGTFKDTWHGVLKPAYVAAHIAPTGYGQALVDHGHKARKTGQLFSNKDQDVAGGFSSDSSSSGTLT